MARKQRVSRDQGSKSPPPDSEQPVSEETVPEELSLSDETGEPEEQSSEAGGDSSTEDRAPANEEPVDAPSVSPEATDVEEDGDASEPPPASGTDIVDGSEDESDAARFGEELEEGPRGIQFDGEGLDEDEMPAEDTEQFLKGLVEAILFVADKPLSSRDVARTAQIDRVRAEELIQLLIQETRGRGVRLVAVSEGYAFRTNAAYSGFVRGFLAQRPVRLSRAQLETLAIVAYRQPVTRPEVDDVRGVDSGAVLKTLLDRDLVRVLGKKDEPGRPMLYGTTPEFLDLFSLKSLRDLPTLREFTELTDESREKFELELGEAAPLGPILQSEEVRDSVIVEAGPASADVEVGESLFPDEAEDSDSAPSVDFEGPDSGPPAPEVSEVEATGSAADDDDDEDDDDEDDDDEDDDDEDEDDDDDEDEDEDDEDEDEDDEDEDEDEDDDDEDEDDDDEDEDDDDEEGKK